MANHQLTTLDDHEKLCWLRLIRTENIGPLTFERLIRQFRKASRALNALPDLARLGGKQSRLQLYAEDKALREMEAVQKFGAQLLASCEPDYPPLLREIPGPPPLLTIKGNRPLLASRTFAVVGARNASMAAKKITTDISQQLGENLWTVASGLARGIDACAHQATLESGTIAVIAGGIDNIYPSENEKLYHRIASEGVLIAESPFGTKPQANLFPKRNRIISGLSEGVLVIEAALKSGSLITARYALEQGRDVYAVPGSPLDPRARGTNHLIREGAILTESYEDIERELATGASTKELSAAPPPEIPPLESMDLEPARKILLENLNYTPIRVDNLLEEYQIPSATLWALLLELEIAGRLNRQPGGYISLKPNQSES